MKDFEIRCDASHLETNHTLYGKFTLGPFLPGQGTTFGNALRRSLLSELSGLAITAFEILGVMQEFSTLLGLRESVLDLSLNLKQVVLTGILPHSVPPIGFLKIKGPAIIKAVDLKLPAGVYCTYPDQYIATLTSNGALNLKFLISVGKGYSVQPSSLYHSLSKIRLQPTLEVLQSSPSSFASSLGGIASTSGSIPSDPKVTSPRDAEGPFSLEKSDTKPNPRSANTVQNSIPFGSASQRLQNDSLHLLEQRNREGIAYSEKPSTRSFFNNTKEMGSQNITNSEYASSAPKHTRPNSTDYTKGQTAYSASYLPYAEEKGQLPTDALPASTSGNISNLRNATFGMQTKEGMQVASPRDAEGEVSKQKNKNELESSVNRTVYQTEGLLSSYPRRGSSWVDETKQDSRSLNQKFLQSTNSEAKEFVNSSLPSLKNANNTTFAYQTDVHSGGSQHPNLLEGNKRCVDIQTQIFQRVNPHQVLPIDAVFTPVSRVNFLTQVNDRFETARENIVLEIWTNGSIHPKRALEEATLLLVQNFDTLLKKIQQASSIYRGLHYVNYLRTQSDPHPAAYSSGQQAQRRQAALFLNPNLRIPKEAKQTQVKKECEAVPEVEGRTFSEQMGPRSEVHFSGVNASYNKNNVKNVTKKITSLSIDAKQEGVRSTDKSSHEIGTLSNSENMGSPRLPSNKAEEAANNKMNGLLPYPNLQYGKEFEGIRSKEAVCIPKVAMPKDSTGPQPVEKKGVTYFERLSSEFSKQHMHQAFFNLDIGNFDLSLQTFIALKEAKIHTLSQLLTLFSSDINSKGFTSLRYSDGSAPERREIEPSLLLNEKIVDELKNVIYHFIN